MKYIIDASTRQVRTLLGRLRKKKGIEACNFGGVYHEDKSLCQLHLLSSLSEDQIEEWLYKSNLHYLGVTESDRIDIECNHEYTDEDWEEMTGLKRYRFGGKA